MDRSVWICMDLHGNLGTGWMEFGLQRQELKFKSKVEGSRMFTKTKWKMVLVSVSFAFVPGFSIGIGIS